MSIIAPCQIKNLKELFHILNSEPGPGEQVILCLNIGIEHCSFAISNPQEKQLYELAYITNGEVNENFLDQLLVIYPRLTNPFHKVFVSYDYLQNTIIPTGDLDQDNAKSLMNSLFDIGNHSTVLTSQILNNTATLVYALHTHVHNWLKSKFSGAIFSHRFQNSTSQIPVNIDEGCIRVDFGTGSFHTIVTRSDKLLLAHTFSYSTPDDVVYYLLKICREYSLSPLSVKLVLSGLIEEQSALFHELYQYFIAIEFTNAEWIVNRDNSYPAHFFTFLNEAVSCES